MTSADKIERLMDPYRIEDKGPRVEVTVRRMGENDLGSYGRPHRLEFCHIIDGHQSHTNVEHMDVAGLLQTRDKINEYLRGIL